MSAQMCWTGCDNHWDLNLSTPLECGQTCSDCGLDCVDHWTVEPQRESQTAAAGLFQQTQQTS